MRPIRENEKKLIRFLAGPNLEIPELVVDLKDGGMGSIKFDLTKKENRVNQIAAAVFTDKDGVLVDIELTSDKAGNLFELDFWKVDFSELVRYPQIENLKIKQ